MKPTRPHPVADTLMGGVAVACDCDPALHRPVSIESTGVNACLRCGTVTCTRSVGDDGRHTGNAWQSFLAVPVSPDLIEWLAEWPRLTIRRHQSHRWPMSDGLGKRDILFLPANTHCETAADLVALEDRLLGRPLEAEFPSAPPPAELTGPLLPYARFQEALRTTADGDPAQMLPFADPRNPASTVVVERLLRRPDVVEILLGALRSPEGLVQSAGVALARAVRPVDPRLPGVIIEILQSLPLTRSAQTPDRLRHWARFEELLVVIGDLQLKTPEMLAALKALQRRLVRLDHDLVRAIGIILRELSGEPPPQPLFPDFFRPGT